MEAGTMERPTHEGAPGEAPDEQHEERTEDRVPELAIDAPRQLSLEVGGRAPDFSSLKIKSKAVRVAGGFDKGDIVSFVIRGRIDGAGGFDTYSGDQIAATEARFWVTPIHIERLAD